MTLNNTIPSIDLPDLNVISLHFVGKAVMAKYIGPHSESVKLLFDSDTLPTAYTTSTPMDSIIAEISRLNPDCLVCWYLDGLQTIAIIEVK
jgi:hypothetical protein